VGRAQHLNAFAAARAGVIAPRQCAAPPRPGLIGDDVRNALATDTGLWREGQPQGARDITQYVHEQGLTARRVGLEELFAPSTLDL
jgi:hypothetical protein